ncbi:hypothetical protein H4R34_002339 [Dimargaris verticillata]|uniref:Enoyl reductase (ER) domain-containing protein n=1 Tax=Dimargaris verticillata TaxID=2761393 RepID=A0A9W8B8A4_9FUNG|nr:hypothetical protein H4R34_002339 [Dimargaris verticillata]
MFSPYQTTSGALPRVGSDDRLLPSGGASLVAPLPRPRSTEMAASSNPGPSPPLDSHMTVDSCSIAHLLNDSAPVSASDCPIEQCQPPKAIDTPPTSPTAPSLASASVTSTATLISLAPTVHTTTSIKSRPTSFFRKIMPATSRPLSQHPSDKPNSEKSAFNCQPTHTNAAGKDACKMPSMSQMLSSPLRTLERFCSPQKPYATGASPTSPSASRIAQSMRCPSRCQGSPLAQDRMKAIRIEGFGDIDVFQFVEMPVPKLHPRCLLVRNEFIGVNYVDILHRKGDFPIALPTVLGREGAGTVVAVGEKLQDQFAVGDRVAYLGNFTYAEYVCVCTKAVYKLPPSIPFDAAAAVLLQGIMALSMVTDAYTVKAGDWVVVTAAAGGTGSILVQLCKNLGAKVIGITSSVEKAQAARQIGADHALLYDQPDLIQEVKRITFGKGAEVVFDGVGRDMFATCLQCCRRCGHLVEFGCCSGKMPPIDIGCLSRDNVKLVRPTLFNYIPNQSQFERLADQLFGLIACGQLVPKIHKVYPICAVGQAHYDLMSRKTVGKLLLKP